MIDWNAEAQRAVAHVEAELSEAHGGEVRLPLSLHHRRLRVVETLGDILEHRHGPSSTDNR